MITIIMIMIIMQKMIKITANDILIIKSKMLANKKYLNKLKNID